MKNGLAVSDAGPVFSFGLIGRLDILAEVFDKIFIPAAVWEEVSKDQSKSAFHQINDFFKDKVKEITSFNELTFVMDFGESESVILYKE